MKRFNVKLVTQKRVINTSLFTSAIVLFLSGFALAPTALAAELVVNGGFEEPVVTSTENWTTYFGENYTAGIATCPVGDTTCNDGMLVPGWGAFWTDTMHAFPDDPSMWLPGRIELQRDPLLCPAVAGDQKAELDSHHRLGNPDHNVTIFQGIEVCPRTPHVLTFSWKGRLNVVGNSDLDVLIDDVILSTHRKFFLDWRDETYRFVSGDEDFTTLAFHSCGDGNTLGVFLDEISLIGPDGSEEEPCPDPDICTDDKPRVLTLLYDGDVNGMDQHNQVSDEVIVEPAGMLSFPSQAHIKVFGQNKNKPELFSAVYNIGDFIEISGPKNRIPPRLKFEIWSMDDPPELVQTVQFHTSCSQPLFIGDEFGAIVVWSAEQ